MGKKYDSMSPTVNALLKEDDTITTLDGTPVDLQAAGDKYKLMHPIKDQVLNPDDTTSLLSDIIGGGGGDMEKAVYDTDDNGIVDDVDTLPTGTYIENEMLKYDQTSDTVIGSGSIDDGITIDHGSKDVACKTVITESTSVNIGPGVVLSDAGGDIVIESNVTGDKYIPVDAQIIKSTGSEHPGFAERAAEVVRDIIQSDDTQTMIGITGYSVNPPVDQDVTRVYFKLINPVTDLRGRVISDVTGEIVKYIPDRDSFNKDIGLSVGAGEQFFDLPSPLREVVGYPITVELFANESIDVLGDGTNPWRAVDHNIITVERIALERDLAMESIGTTLLYGGEVTGNTSTTIDITAGEGRIVSIDAFGVPTINKVSWDAKTNVPITNIATQAGTRFAIDINGDAVQLPVLAIPQTNRDYINISVVAHSLGVVGRITNTGFKNEELYTQLADHLQALGVTRRAGLVPSPNANLTFSKTAGVIEAVGAGVSNSERGQNTVSLSAENPVTFGTVLGITETSVAFLQNNIDPANYDSGAVTPTPIGAPTQQATIQYIYQSILQPEGIVVLYGQTVYPTLDDAVINAPNDNVALPEIILGASNLIGRIAVISNATDLSDPLQAEFLAGVKFGTGSEGGSFGGGGGGGGDYFGAANSSVDEIHTFADTSGKIGKSASDITALGGAIKRVSTDADLVLETNGLGKVVAGNSKFDDGDELNYPISDGFLGDSIRTDGVGGLTLDTDKYDIVTTDTTVEYNDKHVYIDSSANPITITLADNPRVGEKKTFWMGDNTNVVELVSANPSFPISPPPQVAEPNIQGQWTLTSDFLDRFTTNRDLTQQGTGGSFTPATINGSAVNMYNFEGTSYLEAVASSYKGVLGGTPRAFSAWYQSNSIGIPTTAQTLFGWGRQATGQYWLGRFLIPQQQFILDVNAGGIRYPFSTLDAAGLFDGNPHHILIQQSGTATNTIDFYIDGNFVQWTSIANRTLNTVADQNFRLGAHINNGERLDASMYDVRLFDRVLTDNERDIIMNEDLTGGVDISQAENGMVWDMVFDGNAWLFGAGAEALALSNEGRITGLENQPYVYEAELTVLPSAPVQDIGFANQTTVYKVTMTANTTFTFSSAKVGSGCVIELDGNFTPTFPAEWNELNNSLTYAGTLTNLVYVFCMDDTLGAEVFDYTIIRRS